MDIYCISVPVNIQPTALSKHWQPYLWKIDEKPYVDFLGIPTNWVE